MPIWMPRSASFSLSDEQLKGLLKRYDTNKDGKLSRKELKIAFGGRWRAWLAVHHADTNGDGLISEDEMNELVKYARKWGFTIN